MQDIIRRVEGCRVCGREDWLPVLSLGSTPLANGLLERLPPAGEPERAYPVDVLVCRGCWLMSLAHVVDPETLFGHYVYMSSDSDQITEHMAHIVAACTGKLGLAPGDLVVEMGSNIGAQLAMFTARGLRGVGVDPARNLARVANQRGVQTIADFFGPAVGASVQRDHGPARLVLGRQCFAHIDDVHEILEGVDAVLAPDGGLVIEVPYLVDLVDGNQFDTIYHEHLSYFSLGTLSRLFAYHGLRVVDVERAAVHGGSIVVFAVREASGRRPTPAVAGLLALEEARGLATERPYLAFAERTLEVTMALADLVRSLVAQGKRIAGYGAPSKGNALLQACGLSSREIEYVSDTTVLKQGRFWAGTHIPVCSPEQAAENPPDYFLLLAWNYADEIIGKEQGFLAAGGRFIIPSPKPHIVFSDEVSRRPEAVA